MYMENDHTFWTNKLLLSWMNHNQNDSMIYHHELKISVIKDISSRSFISHVLSSFFRIWLPDEEYEFEGVPWVAQWVRVRCWWHQRGRLDSTRAGELCPPQLDGKQQVLENHTKQNYLKNLKRGAFETE